MMTARSEHGARTQREKKQASTHNAECKMEYSPTGDSALLPPVDLGYLLTRSRRPVTAAPFGIELDVKCTEIDARGSYVRRKTSAYEGRVRFRRLRSRITEMCGARARGLAPSRVCRLPDVRRLPAPVARVVVTPEALVIAFRHRVDGRTCHLDARDRREEHDACDQGKDLGLGLLVLLAHVLGPRRRATSAGHPRARRQRGDGGKGVRLFSEELAEHRQPRRGLLLHFRAPCGGEHQKEDKHLHDIWDNTNCVEHNLR